MSAYATMIPPFAAQTLLTLSDDKRSKSQKISETFRYLRCFCRIGPLVQHGPLLLSRIVWISRQPDRNEEDLWRGTGPRWRANPRPSSTTISDAARIKPVMGSCA